MIFPAVWRWYVCCIGKGLFDKRVVFWLVVSHVIVRQLCDFRPVLNLFREVSMGSCLLFLACVAVLMGEPAPETQGHNRDGLGYEELTLQPIRKTTIELDFQIHAGWEKWGMEDLGKSEQYFNDLNILPDFEATTKALPGSGSAGIDCVVWFRLPSDLELGLRGGIAYLMGGTFQHALLDYITESRYSLDIQSLRFPLSLMIRYPVWPRRQVYLACGAGMDWWMPAVRYRYEAGTQGITFVNQGDLKDSGWGMHGFVGVKKDLTQWLSINAGLYYRRHVLDGFSGMVANSEGEKMRARLTMIRDVWGESVSVMSVDEPLGKNVRPARLDFNGFQGFLSTSIRFRFFTN